MVIQRLLFMATIVITSFSNFTAAAAQDRPINCTVDTKLVVMPDGKMSFHRVIDVYHDGDLNYFRFSDEEIKELLVDSFAENKYLDNNKTFVAALPVEIAKKELTTRFEFTLYCSDINKFPYSQMKFIKHMNSDSVSLTIKGSFLDCSALYCKRCSETIVVPGTIVSTLGFHSFDGRKASNVLTPNDFASEPKNDKIVVASKAPREIIYKNDEFDAPDISEFSKRYDAAMSNK